ncbi:diguanylate cyclase [Bacillus timonensis]|nr:diguanylate cyclase [Bacillus timonensis]
MTHKKFHITALIFVLFLLVGWDHVTIPTAEKGIFQLKDWDFEKNGTLKLRGEWDFYWNAQEPSELLNLKPSSIPVPAAWDDQNVYPSTGYGVYHLKIENLQIGKEYGIKVPTLSSSYNFWLNHDLQFTNGKPSTDRKTTIPFNKPMHVFFTATDVSADIYIGISNFHHRNGGMWESLELGTADQIMNVTQKNTAFEMILFGSLLLAGLYHLVLFIHRKKEKKLLFFGVTCLIISMRIIVIGDQILLEFFPTIPWEIVIKIEYLTFFSVVPLFTWFMHYLYKTEVTKKYCLGLSFISALFILVVIFTPAIFYTELLVGYQTVTLITLIYLVISLTKAVFRKREGAIIVSGCATIYALTVINDILYVNRAIETLHLSSFGLFIFIFSQSYIIARSLSSAFGKVEEYSNELSELNRTLEERIHERTKSLQQSKRELQRMNEMLHDLSYQDQLTQLPNRRYFDEVFKKEWDQAVLSGNFLAVLYFDVDHFKAYNDTYGHQLGDDTLIKVAESLKQSLKSSNGFVARMGGEEFVAVVSNQSVERVRRIADECRENVRDLCISHDTSITGRFVTISVGVAIMVPTNNIVPRTLIKLADEALYFAKDKGRNQVYVQELEESKGAVSQKL